MMWIEESDVPNVNFFTNGEIYKSGISKAYRDLSTMWNGIRDFVSIMDGVFEGDYSLSEVMAAGVILTDAREGYLKEGDLYLKKGRYLRVNGCDVFLDISGEEILFDDELRAYTFEGECGRYATIGERRELKKNSNKFDEYDMSPQEFSAFIKNWIERHLQDDHLCIGQVERMFNAPIEIYKKSFIQGKQ